jgi:hypothetical protein
MYLHRTHRKSVFSTMLVVVLLGTPLLGSAQAPVAHGGMGHPPLIQLAILALRERPRRRVGSAKVRAIARRTGRRVRGAVARIRARHDSVRPRLPPHDSYARGPPRSSGR